MGPRRAPGEQLFDQESWTCASLPCIEYWHWFVGVLYTVTPSRPMRDWCSLRRLYGVFPSRIHSGSIGLASRAAPHSPGCRDHWRATSESFVVPNDLGEDRWAHCLDSQRSAPVAAPEKVTAAEKVEVEFPSHQDGFRRPAPQQSVVHQIAPGRLPLPGGDGQNASPYPGRFRGGSWSVRTKPVWQPYGATPRNLVWHRPLASSAANSPQHNSKNEEDQKKGPHRFEGARYTSKSAKKRVRYAHRIAPSSDSTRKGKRWSVKLLEVGNRAPKTESR